MSQPSKGPVVKERVWRFIEALLTHAEDSSNFEIHWEIDKDSGRPNFVVKTKRRFLESLAQLKKPKLTEVIKSLENLQIWDDRRLKRGKGSEIGLFALKLWSRDAQRNREQFEQVWESSRTEKSKALEATFKKSTVSAEAQQDEIDWQDCCRKMLPTELSINPLLHGDGVILTLEDIVPLELVKRKQRPQQKEDFSPEHFQVQASTEYEMPVEHNKFLAQVLETGDSFKNRDRKIAVIGEPGAGKTTLLQEIAKEVEGAGGLPIFLKLADLGGKTLKDYLLEDWLEEATGKRRISDDIQDDFVLQFNLGRVWLLLDGVDEIAATGNLLSSLEKQLKGWVADARIVLTCRLNVWDVGKNDLYSFEKYRIQQLSYPDMVDKFIRRFFSKAGEPTKGEKLIENLERSQPRIRDLVKNPLRLTLLCRTWKKRQGKLPQTKAELYKQFVETFYEWKDKPEISPEKRPLLNQALGELAKNAIDTETTKFRLRESFVRQELDKFDKSLFDLACRVSWINNVGVAAENPDEPVYAFFHPTFQEYFAALAIDDWNFFLPRAHDNRNPKPVSEKYRIFEPQWKEVILLWLGRADILPASKEEFIYKLVNFNDGISYFPFYCLQSFFIAAASIAEFREFSDCSFPDKIVATIVKLAFGSFNFESHGWNMNLPAIAEKARITLQETERRIAIKHLTYLLTNCVDSLDALLIHGQDEQIYKPIVLGRDGALLSFIIVALLTLLKLDPKHFYGNKILNHLVDTFGYDHINDNIKRLNLILINQEHKDLIKVARFCLKFNENDFEIPEKKDTNKNKGLGYNSNNFLEELLNSNSEIDAINILIGEVKSCKDEAGSIQAISKLQEIIRDHLFEVVVKGLKDYLITLANNPVQFFLYTQCYAVIWQCAQKMSYPAFYQAWHPQEELGKTATPYSQSLNQGDLPQNLQSAIANDPQLSQTIHLICIDGSQFMEPDRPAAEIYDQMLDQNCPECDSVPETMQALKLYWNSLRRNSDKQPVLVFYTSSTEPYSEAFLKDLSKFRGEICVVTSPPTSLLQGEGSMSSSGSPSSPWGEGVRGWGSLQLFTPSHAIANLLEWIRTMVVEE